MLHKETHQLIMGQILKEMYTDKSISSFLGFKGGTCAYFFYGLSRFSVDLDFDLFAKDPTDQTLIYEKVQIILQKYGVLKDARRKYNTIFFLLSYGEGDQNVKVELSVRLLVSNLRDHYEVKEYLGISMQVGKKDYLFASKLVALSERKEIAMRDVYDIWFFGSNHWDINETVIQERTGKSTAEYLNDCISIITAIKDTELLHGLGELLGSEKDKAWVRTHLRNEALFVLRNYHSVLNERKYA